MFHRLIETSAFTAYHVPIFLSFHISLGFFYSPATLIVPITLYGISYGRFLLYHNCPLWTSVITFLLLLHLDLYIRRFVSSSSLHSNHRYFIDLRHIGYIACLQATFHSITCLGNSLPTLTSFRHLLYYTSICLS